MAKKPKAKTEKPEADAKTKKPKKSSGNRWGVFSRLLPGMISGIVCILLVSALAFYFLVFEAGKSVEKQYATSQARSYLSLLEQQSQLLVIHAEAIAANEAENEAVAFNLENLEAFEQHLKGLLVSAKNVKAYPLNKARKDDAADPPISFAQLDLIRRAEKNEPHPPEVHLQNGTYYLNIAVALLKNEKPLGTLLISYDFQRLKDLLPALPNELGYVEIVQQFGSAAPFTIYQSGNSQLKSNTPISVGGKYPHWDGVFYNGDIINAPASYISLLAGATGVALVVIIAFTFISNLLVNKALQLNATKLTTSFNDLTSHNKTNSIYTIDTFTSLGNTLERLFHEYDAHVRHSALKSKGTKPKSSADEIEIELDVGHGDDVLNIEINDEDALLMSGSDNSNDELSGLQDIDDDDNLMDLDIVEMADSEESSLGITHSSSMIHDEIFRAYDIRGIVGKTLNEDTAHNIGMAIGSEAMEKGQSSILVARDSRHSSQQLSEALVRGLVATGQKVIDIGVVPTPVLYFATKTLNTQSGVMVTGSHNPPNYNGFKIVISDRTLAQEQIQDLKNRINEGRLTTGQGSYENANVAQDYMDRIVNDVVLARPMRIVVDCGNGVTGGLGPSILESLGCTVTTLFGEPDGDFPNHHPDPSKPENLQALIKAVQEKNADIGIAFDGDGDRIGLVTASGKIIWPDRLLMLYAKDLLSRNPGADIIYDVKCTRDVAELVSTMGGRAIMCQTGHSLMKAKMAETGAVVGGELSGHIFFNDRWYGFDDAIYSAARLLEILSMEPFGADEVFAEFPEKFSTPEISIPVPEDIKFDLIKRLQSEGTFEHGNINTLDGLRIDFPDSWGLIRASNTTPSLVARFEGDTEEALEQVKSAFRAELSAIDNNLNISF